MQLWQVTLVFFIITALFGLYLFSGYTFRIKVHYPLVLVTSHVISALVTTVLFTVFITKILSHQIHAAVVSEILLVIAFFFVICTVLSGLYFYFRFDARRKRARWPMIIAHLIMAGLSFIFAISSISTVAHRQTQGPSYPGNAWYRYNHIHHSNH